MIEMNTKTKMWLTLYRYKCDWKEMKIYFCILWSTIDLELYSWDRRNIRIHMQTIHRFKKKRAINIVFYAILRPVYSLNRLPFHVISMTCANMWHDDEKNLQRTPKYTHNKNSSISQNAYFHDSRYFIACDLRPMNWLMLTSDLLNHFKCLLSMKTSILFINRNKEKNSFVNFSYKLKIAFWNWITHMSNMTSRQENAIFIVIASV